MSIRECVVCFSEKSSNPRDYFTALPLDPARCRKWVKAIGLEDLVYLDIIKLNQTKFVCSYHFATEDFDTQTNCLLDHAVPQLHLTLPPLPDELLLDFPVSSGSQNEDCKSFSLPANVSKSTSEDIDGPSHKLIKKSSERVTTAQTDVLCSFFEDHPEVLRGYKKTPKCRYAVKRKWMQITPQLNSLGPTRNSKSWAKYLCDVKAKLKRKQIKWKQNSDGTGPIICNANDFSEMALRMLRILQQDTNNHQESHESTSDLEMEEDINNESEEYNDNSTMVDIPLEKAMDNTNHIPAFINLPSSPTRNPAVQTTKVTFIRNKCNDEFNTFGENIAQQLRTLPLAVALETQEMLLAVLRKQRLKES